MYVEYHDKIVHTGYKGHVLERCSRVHHSIPTGRGVANLSNNDVPAVCLLNSSMCYRDTTISMSSESFMTIL